MNFKLDYRLSGVVGSRSISLSSLSTSSSVANMTVFLDEFSLESTLEDLDDPLEGDPI